MTITVHTSQIMGDLERLVYIERSQPLRKTWKTGNQSPWIENLNNILQYSTLKS